MSDRTPRTIGARDLVLLVDPDPDTRQIYASILRYRGYDVMATADPCVALVLARTRAPAAIVGEHPLLLPDGSALCQELLHETETRGIPFLAVTGHVTEEELRDARRTHPAGVVRKPAFPTEIARRIDGLLLSERGHGPGSDAPAPRTP